MPGTRAHSLAGEIRFPHSTGQQLLFLCCSDPEGTTSWRTDGVKGPCREASNRGRGPEPSRRKDARSAQPLAHPPAQPSTPVTTSESTGKPLREAESRWRSCEQIDRAIAKATRAWCGSLCCDTWKKKKKTNTEKPKDLGLTVQKNAGSINQTEWQLVSGLGGKSWVERCKSYYLYMQKKYSFALI